LAPIERGSPAAIRRFHCVFSATRFGVASKQPPFACHWPHLHLDCVPGPCPASAGLFIPPTKARSLSLSSHRSTGPGAGLPGPDLGERWPSRLVAAAAEERLSFRSNAARRFAANTYFSQKRSAAKSLAYTREPRPSAMGRGGVSRTLTGDIPGRGGFCPGILNPLAYTDLTAATAAAWFLRVAISGYD
jgi:hypothetical protein